MTPTQQLVDWCRAHRSGAPRAGDIGDRALLAELLREILASHLDRAAAAADVPERWQLAPQGMVKVAGGAAPPFNPADVDDTASALAFLIGFLEDRA